MEVPHFNTCHSRTHAHGSVRRLTPRARAFAFGGKSPCDTRQRGGGAAARLARSTRHSPYDLVPNQNVSRVAVDRVVMVVDDTEG